MKFTAALAQIHPAVADLTANLDKHIHYIDRARAEGADLLIFPELSLTGYNLQDLAHEVAARPTSEDPAFRVLLLASHDLDLVVGFVHEDPRHRFYIAAAYLSQGRVVHIHNKVYLPTYALFDEGRYFARGDTVQAFDTRFGRMGMLICEDFWHASPPYLLWLDGADALLLLSASPGRGLDTGDRLASARWVELVNQAYASLFTSYVLHCNRVGFEDGLNFWGGSAVTGPDGVMLAQAPYFEEALLVQEIDRSQLHRTRSRLPLLRDERTDLTLRELSRILDEPPASHRSFQKGEER